ncbi:MAG: hypothetical protein KGL19_09235 [Bacteroidota bacterium]|nr:hypothetical protein [Bacteroidota bacterium]
MHYFIRRIIFTIVLIILIQILAVAQVKRGDWLIKKFKNADTILLVSHALVEGSTDSQVDISGKIVPYPKLLINKRPNKEIIKEQIMLRGEIVDSLLKILIRPYFDSVIQQGCMLAHHAIFIIKNDKVSFINIAFNCGSYETSKDLEKMEPFDKQKWADLESLFKQLGFKYGF